MESSADDGGGNRNQIANEKHKSKGKSCKGYLYYSSVLNSKSKSPRCVGISRTLQQVPNYIVDETDAELYKTGQQLAEFRYSCIGYSVYMDKKGAGDLNKQAELPFCVGIEILMNKKVTESAADNVPIHSHRNEDGTSSPQPRTQKPAPVPAPFAA